MPRETDAPAADAGAPEDPNLTDPAAGEGEGDGEGEGQEPQRETHAERMARIRADVLGEGEGEEDDEEEGLEAEGGEEGGDDEDAELEAEAGDEDEEEDEDLVTLTFPGRKPDDPPVEITMTREEAEEQGYDPQELVERNRQLNNGYARRQALQAERQEFEAERDEFMEGLRTDPAGFITQHVDPKLRAEVAETVLLELEPDEFKKVRDRVDKWSRNPENRESERTKAELRRLKAEKERREQGAQKDTVKENVRQIGTAVTDLVPEDMDDERAEKFFRIAVREIQDHIQREKLDVLEPEKVPEVLASSGVLEAYGLSPDGSATEGSPSQNGTSSAAPKRAPGKKGSKAKGDARTRMIRRKNAVATPAGASSSAASGFQKVQGERYEDRADRLRKHLGLKPKKG